MVNQFIELYQGCGHCSKYYRPIYKVVCKNERLKIPDTCTWKAAEGSSVHVVPQGLCGHIRVRPAMGKSDNPWTSGLRMAERVNRHEGAQEGDDAASGNGLPLSALGRVLSQQ
jgi:hypothetical protein